MTAIEINTKEELLAYLNETTREGVIEVADRSALPRCGGVGGDVDIETD